MPSVVIDCFPERARDYWEGHAIVAIDVIRATTTAITSVDRGRRCFPVSTVADALALRARLPDALLVGELRGRTPAGFDLGNSPAALAQRTDVERPAILLSSSEFAAALSQAKARGFKTVEVGALAERPTEHYEALADSGLLVVISRDSES